MQEEAHYRRYMLQKWIQKIGSQPLVVNSGTFQTFLLNAQKEVSNKARKYPGSSALKCEKQNKQKDKNF